MMSCSKGANTGMCYSFPLSILASGPLGLVPSVLCERDLLNVYDIMQTYKDDFLSAELLARELLRLKVR